MAKLKDIEREPFFSPNYKDPERRAISLGILLSLPSLLGIVSSRAKIIKGGVFQSVEDSLNEKLSDLLAATERGGIESITSGSKAKEIILDDSTFVQPWDDKNNKDSKLKPFDEKNFGFFIFFSKKLTDLYI